MAIRYLKVLVTKELVSEVYLRVDDADPKFTPRATPVPGHAAMMLDLTTDLEAAAQEAAKRLSDYDWDEWQTSTETVAEVTEAEAADYQVWDANAGKVWNKATTGGE